MNKDGIDKATSRVKEVLNIKTILGVLIVILAICIATIMEGLIVGVSISQLGTSQFWLSVAARTLLKFLATLGTGLIVVSLYYVSKRVKIKREECNKWLKCKNKNFSNFIIKEDKESKIKTWKKYIQEKIVKLTEKSDRIRNIKYREKMKLKIDDLKEKLTEKYILENYDYLPIKYPRRLETSFLVVDALDVNPDISLDVNVDNKIFKSSLLGIIGGVLWALALSLLTASEFTKDGKTLILALIIDIGIILLASTTSVIKNLRISNQYIYGNIIIKIGIMRKFVLEEYGLDEEDVDLVLKKIHVDTEKKDIATNIALQLQSGSIVINDGKFINKDTGEIVAEKTSNNNKRE